MNVCGILRYDDTRLTGSRAMLATQALRAAGTGLRIADIKPSDQDIRQTIEDLARECMDHSAFHRHASPGRPEDLNRPLAEDIWRHIQTWTERTFGRKIQSACPIHVTKIEGAAGLFFWNDQGTCKIEIDQPVLADTPYFLVVLVHEYMHYVHFSLVSRLDYHNSPLILLEGFAEHAARLFHQESSYTLPDKLKKSWSPTYELGRRIVEQICSEGFQLPGFMRGFLTNVPRSNGFRHLDSLFDPRRRR